MGNQEHGTFAGRLRELRGRAGITQQTAAHRLGLHETQYSRYETGDVIPRTGRRGEILAAMGRYADGLSRPEVLSVPFSEHGRLSIELSRAPWPEEVPVLCEALQLRWASKENDDGRV